MGEVADRLSDVVNRIHWLNQDAVEKFGSHQAVLWNHFRHNVEEIGEMAKCLRGTNDEPMENEAVDTAICALAIALLESNGDIESLLSVFDTKLDKWQFRLEEL